MHFTGVWRTCRWSRNTVNQIKIKPIFTINKIIIPLLKVCRKCPPGTYSGVQTGTLGCILCTKCNLNEGIQD
jgi:hypothetical protein